MVYDFLVSYTVISHVSINFHISASVLQRDGNDTLIIQTDCSVKHNVNAWYFQVKNLSRDPLAVYVQIYNSFQGDYMNVELLYLLQINELNREE